jgi:hypothetical protein
MVVLNDFRRSEMLRSAGLNEECSASTDDTCIEKWGNFCGRLSVRPSLPIDGLIGVSDYTVEFLNEIETSFELDRTKNKGYADFIENQCQNRRRGVPARNYLEFKNAYCLQNGCSSGPISHEKRREIFSAFLQQGPLDAETQGLVNFFKKTDLTMMSKAAATQVSYRSSIRDAFENFNVDLPNRPSAAGASTSASTSSSSQSGRSGDNSQSESSQAFQAMSSAFTPAASSNQVFSPFTTPLGREITSPEELENEVTTRRRALEQSDERISETRDERTRALQQGEQERILQLERQLARLEGERTSERRLLDQYESLLRQVQTPQGSIARQGGSDTNTSAQSENSDTRSSSLNRAPSNVSTFTPQPSLAPRSSETAEGDFATSAGSARLTAPGVDSRALASDPGGVLDTLRAGKYSGNEASLIVQNRDFTREQTLEVPVNSSEFARAQDGKFDFIVDNSTLRSFAAGKRLGEEFLLRLRTSSNDEVEVVVKVLEGGELKFVNSRHLSAQPALQEPNRSPASVNRLPILQGLFEGSP